MRESSHLSHEPVSGGVAIPLHLLQQAVGLSVYYVIVVFQPWSLALQMNLPGVLKFGAPASSIAAACHKF